MAVPSSQTISFSGLSTVNYNEDSGNWVSIFSGVTINNQSGSDTLQSISISIPPGAVLDFQGSSGETNAFIQNGFTFTIASISGGVEITFAAPGNSGKTPSLSDWQAALRDIQIDATSAGAIAHGNQTLTITGVPASTGDTVTPGSETVDVTCFLAGTRISTPNGELEIENLKAGDLILTYDGRAVPANWIGRQTISTQFTDELRALPIRIKAGSLGEKVPARDLLVSPDHAMFVGGVLIHAGALVNGTSIVRDANVPATLVYYHVETDDHSLVLAEGAAAESFIDNVDRLRFDNWAEFESLYPTGKIVEELPYPRVKSHRQVPTSIRLALAERAAALSAECMDISAA